MCSPQAPRARARRFGPRCHSGPQRRPRREIAAPGTPRAGASTARCVVAPCTRRHGPSCDSVAPATDTRRMLARSPSNRRRASNRQAVSRASARLADLSLSLFQPEPASHTLISFSARAGLLSPSLEVDRVCRFVMAVTSGPFNAVVLPNPTRGENGSGRDSRRGVAKRNREAAEKHLQAYPSDRVR